MENYALHNRKGQKIVGERSVPAGGIRGTAVLQHGYSGTRNQSHILAMRDAFLECGFQVFNFDTTNSFGESDGDFQDARLGLHAEDFEDVVQWVREQEWFRGELLLGGHSMGGYSAVAYAQKYPNQVDLLVPFAPVVSGSLSMESLKSEYTKEKISAWQESGFIEETSRSTGITKQVPWAQQLERLDHDLLPLADTLTMPTLLIVGSEDNTCPPDHMKQLSGRLPLNRDNQFVICEGGGHTFYSEEHCAFLTETIKGWLNNVKD